MVVHGVVDNAVDVAGGGGRGSWVGSLAWEDLLFGEDAAYFEAVVEMVDAAHFGAVVVAVAAVGMEVLIQNQVAWDTEVVSAVVAGKAVVVDAAIPQVVLADAAVVAVAETAAGDEEVLRPMMEIAIQVVAFAAAAAAELVAAVAQEVVADVPAAQVVSWTMMMVLIPFLEHWAVALHPPAVAAAAAGMAMSPKEKMEPVYYPAVAIASGAAGADDHSNYWVSLMILVQILQHLVLVHLPMVAAVHIAACEGAVDSAWDGIPCPQTQAAVAADAASSVLLLTPDHLPLLWNLPVLRLQMPLKKDPSCHHHRCCCCCYYRQ